MMKRIMIRIGRFFWSWGFLKVVLWTVTLSVLFYAEEDWRGARAWAATQAKWEARGETFDFNKLNPPPVPADQNLAALPLFMMEPDPKYQGTLWPIALERAMRVDEPGGELPGGALGNAQNGKSPDMQKIRDGIAVAYAEAFKTVPPGKDTLSQFDSLYPFVADLRNAATARPFCRFQQGYQFEVTDHLFISLFTAQITLSKILTFHAVLALAAHQPDLALDDLKTNFKLNSGLRREPLLLTSLCAIVAVTYSYSALRDGLATHAWNDAQLTELENELASIDFLTVYQADLRGDTCVSIVAFNQLKARRPPMYVSDLDARNQGDISKRKVLADMFPDLWADGWIDWMKVQAADFVLNAVRFVDPKARMVYPEKVDQFAAEIAQRQHGWSHDLWHILTDEASGPIVEAVQGFAVAQATVDEARIACALERYRLAHGAYPASLAAAASYFSGPMPHDIMNGQPYHYRLLPNGTFMIYSVGWNQKDDGGKVVYRADEPRAIDYEQGDWVWAAPK
jgi:hypothetical protein